MSLLRSGYCFRIWVDSILGYAICAVWISSTLSCHSPTTLGPLAWSPRGPPRPPLAPLPPPPPARAAPPPPAPPPYHRGRGFSRPLPRAPSHGGARGGRGAPPLGACRAAGRRGRLGRGPGGGGGGGGVGGGGPGGGLHEWSTDYAIHICRG